VPQAFFETIGLKQSHILVFLHIYNKKYYEKRKR